MVIRRKLIIPTLLMIAIILFLALVYFAFNAARQLTQEQNRALQGLQQGLQSEIARLEDVSLALARQVANEPSVKSAFGTRNYPQLLTLTRPGLLSLRGEYKISGYQFSRAPAQVVLDVVDPTRAGQDLSGLRPMLVAANTQGIEVVGMELMEYGLCIHGISPIEGHSPSGAPVNGTVEYGLRMDASTFSDLHAQYGGEWQFLLYVPAATAAGVEDLMTAEIPADVATPAELALQVATLERPIFASPGQYRRALEGETPVEVIQAGEQQYAILTIPLTDYSGQVVGVVDILWDRTALVDQMARYLFLALIVGLVGLIVAGLMLSRIIGNILSPLQPLAATVNAFAQGNLRYPLPLTHPEQAAPDEIEQLSRNFQTIGQQLRQLNGDLETIIAERTRGLAQRNGQMEAAAEIARQAASISQLDDLLWQSAVLIQKRFNYDHVGIYMLDPTGENVNLRAFAGERIQFPDDSRANAQRTLRVVMSGVGQGLVSAAIAANRAIFSADVVHDPFYLPDPLLPGSRSQAALPLQVGGKVIGVLDLHSHKQGAFGLIPGENQPGASPAQSALQTIADQLATAISNIQLIEALEQTVAELGEARGQQTSENWLAFVRSRPSAVGYRYARESLHAGASVAGGLQAIQRDELLPAMAIENTVEIAEELNIPIRLRDKTIGVIRLRFDSPAARAQVSAVAEEVSTRLALLLESARLLEEAQSRAQREQQINVISAQMRAAVDLEGVLQNTVRELGKALGARRTFIQLGDFAVSGSTAGMVNPGGSALVDPEAEA